MPYLQKKEKGLEGKKRKARSSDDEKDESAAEEVLTKPKKKSKKVGCQALAVKSRGTLVT